ncbi:MAG: TetR/AcrR family transcriptional regulator [Anaerolineae bacterium]|jgi:AcrR family transcriptional regulator|nr:TetR/AcrR family transcriptional regulator [Anaerolineae bacterium]
MDTPSEARERVLHVAERLFAQRGYAAVTIKDIAAEVGIHHASLYHHVPKGKASLFVEVMDRTIARHADGIARAIAHGAPDLRQQLYGVAAWLLSQPPMDMIRLVHSDVPSLDSTAGYHLLSTAHAALIEPIAVALQAAQARGDIGSCDLGNLAGGIFSLIQGLHLLPEAYQQRPRLEMAHELVDIFLAGVQTRTSR